MYFNFPTHVPSLLVTIVTNKLGTTSVFWPTKTIVFVGQKTLVFSYALTKQVLVHSCPTICCVNFKMIQTKICAKIYDNLSIFCL